MVRHRLDSVNDFARQGYLLKITCRRCRRSVVRDPVQFIQELHLLRRSRAIDSLERRMRCQSCRARGAIISPTYPEP